jgi:glycosyltransferase involved in cell wall biosynthesis
MLFDGMKSALPLRKAATLARVVLGQGPAAAWGLALRKLSARIVAPEVARLAAEQEVARRELAALQQQLRISNDSIRRLTGLLANNAAPAAVPGAVPAAAPMKISVVMPVYNRAGLAGAAIRSVLAQSGAEFELIVADDGSTDGFSKQTVAELNDPRVRLLSLPRMGPPAARNRALGEATGDVIVYLDSDNTMYPFYLHAVAAAFAAAPMADSAYAAMLWDDGASAVHLRHDDFSWAELFANRINLDLNCFSHRRRLFEAHGGFDETLTKHADFDLALRYTRDPAPLRIQAVAAHYYAGQAVSRLSDVEASGPNFARILAKHRAAPPPGLKILFYCWDYPQLSESYVDTEIAYLLTLGHRIEVFQSKLPGAPGVAQVPVHAVGLERVIDTFQPDVIHCHWLPLAAPVSEHAARRGIPVTVRGHGFEFSEPSLAACAALPAVKSIYLFPIFAEAAPDYGGKVQAVTACFNPRRFYPRLQKDRRMVLRAAACLDSKDIEAFIRVAARCPALRFVLALARIAALPDLPGDLAALNASLGNPVDIRMDVANEAMAALTGQAGIYLHTFGFKQPFGMPVSIAEAMACGAVLLVRDCPAARAYAGANAFYYDYEDEAVEYINATLHWSAADWTERAKRAADFAYAHYTDDAVMDPIVEDWRRILRAKKDAVVL